MLLVLKWGHQRSASACGLSMEFKSRRRKEGGARTCNQNLRNEKKETKTVNPVEEVPSIIFLIGLRFGDWIIQKNPGNCSA